MNEKYDEKIKLKIQSFGEQVTMLMWKNDNFWRNSNSTRVLGKKKHRQTMRLVLKNNLTAWHWWRGAWSFYSC